MKIQNILSKKNNALLQIMDFADKAHGNQVRKYIPRRYIIHPVRVMKRCRQYTGEFHVLAAALLHDVLEDTKVGRDELMSFLETVTNTALAEKILNLVVELTDIYTVENFPYLDRKARKMMEASRLEHISPEAQLIKYADIMDNTNEIVDCDPDFAMTYLEECSMLLGKMILGDFELYKLVVQKVSARTARCKSLREMLESQKQLVLISA